MDEKKKEGTATFYNGYNCAQSVLSVFAEELGMSKDTCLKQASPFGSGIAYMQETCGAVSGALMAIGLKYGRGNIEKPVDYFDSNNIKTFWNFLSFPLQIISMKVAFIIAVRPQRP